ncbi:hypothetical protein H9L13_08785 [Sphingomonas lutea]|uniref:Uncharacterized protein n=1 Tax=Sphingomonas lutea TaxID=1045317 RepID=A0A7G9SFZ3_9SPHN|nr:hypothetical protein [Sphingomonas lutea]QNN66768.1 hypothetical protein H9L13_08785 [Sphingomonas lutea]
MTETPLKIALRAYFLRKNLAALPFELVGAAAAYWLAADLITALLYLMLGDLVGDQIGRRIAQARGDLDHLTGNEIRKFQIPKRWIGGLGLLLVPLIVALITYRSGLPPHEIAAIAGVSWSISTLAYRYFALRREKLEVANA